MKPYKKILIGASIILLAAGCKASQTAKKPVAPTPTGYAVTSETVTVSEEVLGTDLPLHTYTVKNGTTALDLLKTYNKVSVSLSSTTPPVISSLEGLDADKTHSWIFLVNDDPAVGQTADKYVLKDGDKITWQIMAEGSMN